MEGSRKQNLIIWRLWPLLFLPKKNAFEPVGSFMWPRCENFTAQKKKMLVED
jgi:hypothetical protein